MKIIRFYAYYTLSKMLASNDDMLSGFIRLGVVFLHITGIKRICRKKRFRVYSKVFKTEGKRSNWLCSVYVTPLILEYIGCWMVPYEKRQINIRDTKATLNKISIFFFLLPNCDKPIISFCTILEKNRLRFLPFQLFTCLFKKGKYSGTPKIAFWTVYRFTELFRV